MIAKQIGKETESHESFISLAIQHLEKTQVYLKKHAKSKRPKMLVYISWFVYRSENSVRFEPFRRSVAN